MAEFNEGDLVQKLHNLNASQESIQTVSHWCQMQRRQAPAVVATFVHELQKADPQKKLFFIFLMNDVIQNSRKKGPEFLIAFERVVPQVLHEIGAACPDAIIHKVARVVNIWAQREVYPSTKTENWVTLLHRGLDAVNVPATSPPSSGPSTHTESTYALEAASMAIPFTPSRSAPSVLEPCEKLLGRLSTLTVKKAMFEEHATKIPDESGALTLLSTAERASAVQTLSKLRDTVKTESQARAALCGELRSLADSEAEVCKILTTKLAELDERLAAIAALPPAADYQDHAQAASAATEGPAHDPTLPVDEPDPKRQKVDVSSGPVASLWTPDPNLQSEHVAAAVLSEPHAVTGPSAPAGTVTSAPVDLGPISDPNVHSLDTTHLTGTLGGPDHLNDVPAWKPLPSYQSGHVAQNPNWNQMPTWNSQ